MTNGDADLLKVGDTWIVKSSVRYYMEDNEHSPTPGAITVVFHKADDENNSEYDDTLFFDGDEAKMLKRWLDRHCDNVELRP